MHTPYIKAKSVSESNIDPTKFNVITHDVYERINNATITKEIARAYFNLAPSSTVVLFFGAIAEYKGFDILLKALSEIDNKLEFQVLVAGKVSLDFKKN